MYSITFEDGQFVDFIKLNRDAEDVKKDESKFSEYVILTPVLKEKELCESAKVSLFKHFKKKFKVVEVPEHDAPIDAPANAETESGQGIEIPDELKQLPFWGYCKLERSQVNGELKERKIPCDSNGRKCAQASNLSQFSEIKLPLPDGYFLRFSLGGTDRNSPEGKVNPPGIIVLDYDKVFIDNKFISKEIEAEITSLSQMGFVEVSQSGRGFHVFCKAPQDWNPDNNIVSGNQQPEIFYTDKYIMVTGRRYNDSPLRLIDADAVLMKILARQKPAEQKPAAKKIETVSKSKSNDVQNPVTLKRYTIDDYDVRVTEFLEPLNPEVLPDGSILGSHPIHGSTSGSNLHVSRDGMTWYCFRDHVGGGILKAVAVGRRIIECKNADRELTTDEKHQCWKILDEMRPDIAQKKRDAYRQMKHNEQMLRIANADAAMAQELDMNDDIECEITPEEAKRIKQGFNQIKKTPLFNGVIDKDKDISQYAQELCNNIAKFVPSIKQLDEIYKKSEFYKKHYSNGEWTEQLEKQIFLSAWSNRNAQNNESNIIAKANELISGEEKELPVWLRKMPIREPLTFPLDEGTIYGFTDEGNARRFMTEAGDWLVYDKSFISGGEWYAFEKTRWMKADEKLSLAGRFVGKSVAFETIESADEDDEERAKNLFKILKGWQKYSQSRRGVDNMISMAQSSMTRDFEHDANFDLLACKNGILDTSTGKFYGMDKVQEFKSQYPVCYVDCEYIPGAKSERWEQHIQTVFYDNSGEINEEERIKRQSELSAYFKRVCGMMLLNGNPEQIFLFFWGYGNNGKSITIDVMHGILGEQLSGAALSQLYSSDTDKPTPTIANGIAARVLVMEEANRGGNGKLSLSFVKVLGGNSPTERFRRMHEDNIKRPIRCLPIGITNSLPEFDSEPDDGWERRLVTLPWKHKFSKEERIKDFHKVLLKDRDAIFSSWVDELKLYLKEGIMDVPACASATQVELLVGSDRHEFFTMHLMKSEDKRITRNELKFIYLRWCEERGIEVSTKTKWVGDIKETVLAKDEVNRLFSAARILGYKEGKDGKGERFIYAELNHSRQCSLNE